MESRKFAGIASLHGINTGVRATAPSTVSSSDIQKRFAWGTKEMKYGNRKTVIDGITFDSAKEANRWCELKLLQRAGEIYDLQRQVSFTLIPKQVRDGMVIERPVVYKADFVYKDLTGAEIVEDVKSPATKTKEYIIKRKLLLWQFGIQIKEV